MGGRNYRYNITCSNSTSKNWTPTAVECFELGCQCNKCGLYKIYFSNSTTKCMMKMTVIELVRKLGIPGQSTL